MRGALKVDGVVVVDSRNNWGEGGWGWGGDRMNEIVLDQEW